MKYKSMQVNLGMKKIIDLQNKKELIEALFYKICIQVLIIFKELSLLNQAINNYFYRPTPTPNGEWAGLKPSPGEGGGCSIVQKKMTGD